MLLEGQTDAEHEEDAFSTTKMLMMLNYPCATHGGRTLLKRDILDVDHSCHHL